MDSGNSGSISSSGDEEYDSRANHQTSLPSSFLNNHPTHFGSISHPTSSSFVSSDHHHSMFDLSSSYLNSTLSQSQANSTNPHSLLNLESAIISQSQRSEANCTDPASLPSSSSINQCLLGPQAFSHDDNARQLSSEPTNNVQRNSKKRTRASRRAPTTVLTTDTTNFRSMVQEFTGIPSSPFSASSSSSRRLDLLAGLPFYPLRPSAQPNPFLSSSRLLHNNMVDAIVSNTNNSSPNNSISFQISPDLCLPYHQPQNIMLNMQNHPILNAFHPSHPPLHPLVNTTIPAGFGAKSQASLSTPSLEEDLGMRHGQVNGCRDGSTVGGSSSSLNHEKTLEINASSARGEGTVDSWICSSD